MLRFIHLNPRVFVDLLVQAGCVTGIHKHGMQQVSRPGQPKLTIVVRMGQPVTSEELVSHLANLGIAESAFRELLDRYRPKPK